MRPSGNEPPEEDVRHLLSDEERRALDQADVPEDAKSEILERLERRRVAELEEQILDEPPER